MKILQFFLGLFRKSSPPSLSDDWAEVSQWLLASEGGYSNRASDHGGPTNMGITLATLTHWRGHPCTYEDVQALSQAEALSIYWTNYWHAMRCDELPHGVNYIVMDAGVMSGPSRAIKMLQQVVNVDQDGIIGKDTMAAVKDEAPAYIVTQMSAVRENFYRSLNQPDNQNGWLIRVARARDQAHSMIV
jgi:lysozyme family protein